MRFENIRFLLMALVIGVAAITLSLGLLGSATPALAQEQELGALAPLMQLEPDGPLVITIVFTDPAAIEITDLAGDVVGEGVHLGSVRCQGDNCGQKTHIVFTDPAFTIVEYRYRSLVAFDPGAGRAIVSGMGKLGKNERFMFTATFQDNRDGTISVIYQSSRPDASFIVPASPGSFRIRS